MPSRTIKSLPTIATIAAVSFSLQAQVSINNNGLEKQGVEIRQGSDPYSVEIWNNSKRTILELSTRLEYDGPRDGRAVGSGNSYGTIAPGGHAVISALGPANPPVVKPKGSVDISLESVLWDDFTCSGPDREHGCDEAMARWKAERDLYNEISIAGNVGDDAVIQKLRDAGAGKSRLDPALAKTYKDHYDYSKQQKAQNLYNHLAPGKMPAIVGFARKKLATTKYPKD